jgi:hypothetical protein
MKWEADGPNTETRLSSKLSTKFWRKFGFFGEKNVKKRFFLGLF